MDQKNLCKHIDISAKYTTVKHYVNDKEVTVMVHTWVCRECRAYGTDIVNRMPTADIAVGCQTAMALQA